MDELVGDPTPLGWATTLAYLAAAAVAVLAASRASRDRIVLALTSLSLLALGVNKQLDLQQWLFVYGREATIELGLYDSHRHDVHVAAALAAAVLGLLALLVAVALLWRRLRHAALLAIGAALIATYAIVRSAIFHGLEPLASLDGADGIAAIELVGVLFVAVGAWRLSRAPR